MSYAIVGFGKPGPALAHAFAREANKQAGHRRRISAEDVNWPKASEGGRVRGKAEIRAYWTRQWREFDGHVEPVAITEQEEGKIRVREHQLVKNLEGDVLSDSRAA